jgi:glucose-6-phosphate 1-dehydrogenase
MPTLPNSAEARAKIVEALKLDLLGPHLNLSTPAHRHNGKQWRHEEKQQLGFQAKYPGPKMQLRPVDMRFSYRQSFDAPSPDAYETLLWDVMKNDATLFMRADQVEAAWQLLMPVLEVWAEAPPSDFPNYAAGTWEPEESKGLLACGHSWPLPAELVGQCKKRGKNS